MALRCREGTTMAQRGDKKRLGKKHRQASTRPKKGRAPKSTPTTGAVDPRKRKILASKRAETDKAARVTKQSPDREKRKTIRGDSAAGAKKPVRRAGLPGSKAAEERPADGIVGRQTPRSANVAGRERIEEFDDWRDVELLASQMATET